MALPNYKEVMLPLLKPVGDVKEHHIKKVYDGLVEEFHWLMRRKRNVYPVERADSLIIV